MSWLKCEGQMTTSVHSPAPHVGSEDQTQVGHQASSNLYLMSSLSGPSLKAFTFRSIFFLSRVSQSSIGQLLRRDWNPFSTPGKEMLLACPCIIKSHPPPNIHALSLQHQTCRGWGWGEQSQVSFKGREPVLIRKSSRCFLSGSQLFASATSWTLGGGQKCYRHNQEAAGSPQSGRRATAEVVGVGRLGEPGLRWGRDHYLPKALKLCWGFGGSGESPLQGG